MPHTRQRPSRALVAALVATHLVATPVITWLAIVYSALGAPWWAVSAVWHAQAVLLGIWCALSAVPLPRKLTVSLTGLLWLSAMPAARELVLRGFPTVSRGWLYCAIVFGLQPLYLAVSFVASVTALAMARTVWPRWRIITPGSNFRPRASQFSMRELMLGVTGCTPILLAARLIHDYATVTPVRNVTALVLVAVVESPVAAAVAILSTWAALGRSYVIGRVTAAPLLLLLAVLLGCFATRTPTSGISGTLLFEELQILVAVPTLLAFRWQGYRIGKVPTGSPFLEADAPQG